MNRVTATTTILAIRRESCSKCSTVNGSEGCKGCSEQTIIDRLNVAADNPATTLYVEYLAGVLADTTICAEVREWATSELLVETASIKAATYFNTLLGNPMEALSALSIY